MSKLSVANIIFETTESNRIEYTGNNVVRVRANGGLQIPFGTTAQRASPEYGLLRYNTDTGTVEMYDAGGWFDMPTGGYVNVIYTTANAAYALANNVSPQLAPAFNTANAAFNKANNALANTNDTVFNGTLHISDRLKVGTYINADDGGTSSAYIDLRYNGTARIDDFRAPTQVQTNYISGWQPFQPFQIAQYSANVDVITNQQFDVQTGGGYQYFYTSNTVSYISSNVGIGTTSPTYKLDVVGTINAANILINGASIAANLAPAYNTANAAFNTANAAYNSANNVAPQVTPAFNTANLAYTQANAAYTAANTKFSSSGGSITGAVEINGSLTVHGNTIFVDQQTLSVGDPLIYLAANNYSSDVVDIGFVANYVNSSSINVHTGLFRSSGTKEYYLFQGYDKEPNNNYIDPTGNNISMAILNSTIRTSNLILGGANALGTISSVYGQVNTNTTALTSVYNTANAVYNQSNVVFGVANAAFAKANSGMQNTTFTLNGSLTIANTNTISAPIWYENESNITASYTLTTGRNAMTAGPVTLNTGVTITVPVGSTWTVV